jgi:adenosylcobinamide-phosphate synthase
MLIYKLFDANFHYILIGFFLEFWINYPNFLPHPVVFMGKAVNFCEKVFYVKDKNPNKLKRNGILVVLILVSVTYALFALIDKFLSESLIKWIMKIFFAYTIVATGSLLTECSKVLYLVQSDNMEKAREQLSMLVTRDTKMMEKEEIIRTTIETLSENLCDGVVAPLFYMFVGGIPLGMAYKMVSTLDSMLGYKNERYLYFGWATAKLDDIFAWLPARLTAFFIFIASFIMGFDWQKSVVIWRRDRNKTDSPNSGHPESAFAGAVGVWFGGKVRYFGKVYEKPIIGVKGEHIKEEHLQKSLNLAMGSSFVAVISMSIIEGVCRLW